MNTVYTQFQQALKREKQYITTYYDNIQYPCLYRKVDDYKNTSNHIEIFYDIDTPIKQGQLLTHGGKAFIVMNKESIENDTYYKSVIKKCNVTVPVVINKTFEHIPCYSYDLTSSYSIKNNTIVFLDGEGELITEKIEELSLETYLDKGLRIMGGYYKVVNIYDIDNITHLMIKAESKPTGDTNQFVVKVKTDEDGKYVEGETAQIITTAITNDIVIEDAEVTFISSDETIATVNENGLITFVSVGNVDITVTWVGKDLLEILNLTVIKNDDLEGYFISIIQSTELKANGYSAATFYPTLKDKNDNVIEITETPVWTFNYNGMPTSDFTITYEDNQVRIKVANNIDLVGEVLRIICTTADGLYSGYKDVVIFY